MRNAMIHSTDARRTSDWNLNPITGGRDSRPRVLDVGVEPNPTSGASDVAIPGPKLIVAWLLYAFEVLGRSGTMRVARLR